MLSVNVRHSRIGQRSPTCEHLETGISRSPTWGNNKKMDVPLVFGPQIRDCNIDKHHGRFSAFVRRYALYAKQAGVP